MRDDEQGIYHGLREQWNDDRGELLWVAVLLGGSIGGLLLVLLLAGVGVVR